MTGREEARRIVAATTMPQPKQETIARVEAQKYQEFPPCEHGGCLVIAKLVWGWALENGCTIVEVVNGQHKHRFDLIELARLREVNPVKPKNMFGGKSIPRGFHQHAHGRLGSFADKMHNYVPVTTSFSANGRRKESSHV